MSEFEMKKWKNRESEFPNRRRFVPTGIDSVFDVEREEGIVFEEGDSFVDIEMTAMEKRIDKAFSRSMPTFKANAFVQDDSIYIETQAPEGWVDYNIVFSAPEQYREAKKWFIDKAPMQKLLGIDGSKIPNNVFAQGAPVTIARCGDIAYLTSGSALNPNAIPWDSIVGKPTKFTIDKKLLWDGDVLSGTTITIPDIDEFNDFLIEVTGGHIRAFRNNNIISGTGSAFLNYTRAYLSVFYATFTSTTAMTPVTTYINLQSNTAISIGTGRINKIYGIYASEVTV